MSRPRFQSEELGARDRVLVEACRAANRDAEVRAIEKEFDAIKGDLVEPWRRFLKQGKLRRKSRRSARRQP
jgi:hypothetical protein